MTPTTCPVQSARSSRLTLLLLAAVFVLPFVAGSILFLSGWRSEHTRQHGELIQPVIPLPASGLKTTDGQPLPTSALYGQWLLMLPINDSCNAACDRELLQMLHVHIALNKEQSRLRRVLITNGTDRSGLSRIQARYPNLVIGVLSEMEAGDGWRKALSANANAIFVADPFGNLMMRYENPDRMQGVLKDLERLLKYSWVR